MATQKNILNLQKNFILNSDKLINLIGFIIVNSQVETYAVIQLEQIKISNRH